MLFNSLDFAIFLPLVFLLYWAIPAPALSWRTGLLVVASYFFYGWWDYRFLSLLLFSTGVDFVLGRQLARTTAAGRRKWLIACSLLVNVGILAVFKYYNFFTESFAGAFRAFGMEASDFTLDVVLPVGISFYTFQTLSYTIDVYRQRIPSERSLLTFAAYVSFFPQLVAGPIERAAHLLPQFRVAHRFDYALAVSGCRQILWGLFKKVVVADTCAQSVDLIFSGADTYGGSTLLLGAVLFAFQIYGDFSGYSDIAIGTAKLFGFRLMRNFAFPYFSRDIGEFWRRWHISLSTWFRDYLYIPLGGSRGSQRQRVRNVFIIFLVSGLWHGANWTFVAWGALHALLFLPLLLTSTNRRHLETPATDRLLPAPAEAGRMLLTFGLVTIAWVFFRAPDIESALEYLGSMASASLLSVPEVRPYVLVLMIGLLIAVEWVGRRSDYGMDFLWNKWNRPLRFASYYLLLFLVAYHSGRTDTFIYFQF